MPIYIYRHVGLRGRIGQSQYSTHAQTERKQAQIIIPTVVTIKLETKRLHKIPRMI